MPRGEASFPRTSRPSNTNCLALGSPSALRRCPAIKTFACAPPVAGGGTPGGRPRASAVGRCETRALTHRVGDGGRPSEVDLGWLGVRFVDVLRKRLYRVSSPQTFFRSRGAINPGSSQGVAASLSGSHAICSPPSSWASSPSFSLSQPSSAAQAASRGDPPAGGTARRTCSRESRTPSPAGAH
jgi:hypothetical protein